MKFCIKPKDKSDEFNTSIYDDFVFAGVAHEGDC